MRFVAFLVAVCAAAFTTSAFAQVGAPDDEEIYVTGQRLREQIEQFVDEVAAPAPGERQIGRWDRDICPGAAGVSAAFGRAVIDRLSRRARDLGLRPGRQGCRANIYLLFTPHAASIAEQVMQDRRLRIRYAPSSVRWPRPVDIELFERTTRPVRWLHFHTIEPAGTQPSRIVRGSRQDIGFVIIVIDTNYLQGMTAYSVGDYLAMVTLAHIDPLGEPPSAPSILALFERPAHAPELTMTTWDTSFLRGVYAARRNARTSGNQANDITETMVRTLERLPPVQLYGEGGR